MPSITLVAVWTLNEDGTVTEAFRKHLTANIIQAYTFTCHLQNILNTCIKIKLPTWSQESSHKSRVEVTNHYFILIFTLEQF